MIVLKNVLAFYCLLFKNWEFYEQQISISEQCMKNFGVFAAKLRQGPMKELREFAKGQEWDFMRISKLEDYIEKVEKLGFRFNNINSDLLIILKKPLKPVTVEYSKFVVEVAFKMKIYIEKLIKMAAQNLNMETDVVREVGTFLREIFDFLQKTIDDTAYDFKILGKPKYFPYQKILNSSDSQRHRLHRKTQPTLRRPNGIDVQQQLPGSNPVFHAYPGPNPLRGQKNDAPVPRKSKVPHPKLHNRKTLQLERDLRPKEPLQLPPDFHFLAGGSYSLHKTHPRSPHKKPIYRRSLNLCPILHRNVRHPKRL